MITKKNIQVISVDSNNKNSVTIRYKILVLGGLEDTCKIVMKNDEPVIHSELISNLNLPESIEMELIIAIIDSVDGYKNKLN